MKVKIYIEGGGDSKASHSECRRGFRKLLEKAGFADGRPQTIACGRRSSAFDRFARATRLSEPDVYPVLLVDSESSVSKEPWEHLKDSDGWDRPDGVEDDQAHLMVQCMETWIVADREAVRRFFGQDLLANALPSTVDLEKRSKDDVQKRLEHATKDCGKDRTYKKGRRSFELLAQLDPQTLKGLLPHFSRFCGVLDNKLR